MVLEIKNDNTHALKTVDMMPLRKTKLDDCDRFQPFITDGRYLRYTEY